MTTLGQFKESTVGSAIGIAPCDPSFLKWVNEGQERLAPKGRWWGTTRRIRVCVTAKCITWPAGVVNVEGFNLLHRGVLIRNRWYEFQEDVRSNAASTCLCGPNQLLDRGFSTQFKDFTANSTIRIYPRVAADADAVVLLQGTDQNGLVVRNNDGDDYFDGERVTLVYPFAESVTIFKGPGLSGAQKPITKGHLDVFAVNADTAEETQIATWGPNETNPRFKRSYLQHLPPNGGRVDTGDGCGPADTGCTGLVAEAIVRLEPTPVVSDSDYLFIGCKAAMKAMLKAMVKEDQSDYTGAAIEEGRAIALLKEELSMYDPKERTQVNQVMGATFRSRRMVH